MTSPTLYIIAGCNGAGKTTASFTVLPEILTCSEFVNADEIAKGLSPFHPEDMAITAGKLMLQRIEDLLSEGKTFAIETTLATRSYTSLISRAHDIGYKVVLIFFWLPTPEMAVERVKQRVAAGGHNIPIDVIYRRYNAGISNLLNIYISAVDEWSLYESKELLNPIVELGQVIDEEKFNKIKGYVRE